MMNIIVILKLLLTLTLLLVQLLLGLPYAPAKQATVLAGFVCVCRRRRCR